MASSTREFHHSRSRTNRNFPQTSRLSHRNDDLRENLENKLKFQECFGIESKSSRTRPASIKRVTENREKTDNKQFKDLRELLNSKRNPAKSTDRLDAENFDKLSNQKELKIPENDEKLPEKEPQKERIRKQIRVRNPAGRLADLVRLQVVDAVERNRKRENSSSSDSKSDSQISLIEISSSSEPSPKSEDKISTEKVMEKVQAHLEEVSSSSGNENWLDMLDEEESSEKCRGSKNPEKELRNRNSQKEVRKVSQEARDRLLKSLRITRDFQLDISGPRSVKLESNSETENPRVRFQKNISEPQKSNQSSQDDRNKPIGTSREPQTESQIKLLRSKSFRQESQQELHRVSKEQHTVQLESQGDCLDTQRDYLDFQKSFKTPQNPPVAGHKIEVIISSRSEPKVQLEPQQLNQTSSLKAIPQVTSESNLERRTPSPTNSTDSSSSVTDTFGAPSKLEARLKKIRGKSVDGNLTSSTESLKSNGFNANAKAFYPKYRMPKEVIGSGDSEVISQTESEVIYRTGSESAFNRESKVMSTESEEIETVYYDSHHAFMLSPYVEVEEKKDVPKSDTLTHDQMINLLYVTTTAPKYLHEALSYYMEYYQEIGQDLCKQAVNDVLVAKGIEYKTCDFTLLS